MKPEVYRCIKILEALRIGVRNMWINGFTESVGSLQKQYSEICEVLKENLSPQDFKMIQIVEPVDFSRYDSFDRSNVKDGLMQKLIVSLDMTLAYLRSLDMDLNKEVIREKRELEKMREELESKTKEVESLKKIYEEIVNIKKGLPELIRSRVTEEIKESHRGIERNTNPNTKSQQKRNNIEEIKSD